MTKKSVVLFQVSLLSLSLMSVHAEAGLFSWLFGKDTKTTQTQHDTQQTLSQDDAGSSHDHEHDHSHDEHVVGTEANYQLWLNKSPYNRQTASDYEAYLVRELGRDKVPPMRELLTTARSWQKCGYDPYQVPPSELWGQMIPTIKLYNELRAKGILPAHTQIRSVYRSPELNRCAGGAAGSKHLTNGAMDIWIPDYAVGTWLLSDTQDKLCQYWIDNGESHQFGLGIYSTGAIHLDTQGYRKWGGQFTHTNSPCRYIPPKKELLYQDGVGWWTP